MVTIGLSNKVISVTCDNYKRITKLIEGQFPNYKRVIPTTTETALFDAKELTTVIKNLIPLADKKASYKTKLTIDGKGSAFLETITDNSNATKKVACKAKNELEVGFNLKAFQSVISDTSPIVTLEYSDSTHAFCVKDGNSLRIIMPMTLD